MSTPETDLVIAQAMRDHLSGPQKRVVELSHGVGTLDGKPLSQEQIADELDMTIEGVKAVLEAGLKILRQRLRS